MDNNRPPPTRGRARGRGTSSARSTPTPERTLPPVASAVTPSTSGTAAAPAAAALSTPADAALVEDQPQGGMQKLRIEDSSKVPYSRYTYRTTRPQWLETKQSSQPETLKLVTNYFNVSVAEDFCIHQYMVTFDPPLEDDQTLQRKGLFRTVASQLPGNIFDGLMLFTVSELTTLPTILTSTDKFTGKPVTITIDCHKAVDRRDPACFQIYNIFVRKCLEHCKFVEMGRRYYDPSLKNDIPRFELEVWPGFATSLRFFESKLLLNVESVCKVVRKKSIFDIMQDVRIMNRSKNEELIRKLIAEEVEGRIVMTHYNNHRTYPVEKILWDERITDTFPCKDGSSMDYVTYFQKRWGKKLQRMEQPLLLVAQKEKELRRGRQTLIKLIPEITFATGLTDSMRSNFQLMKELGNFAHAVPTKRVISLTNFMKQFTRNEQIKEEMKKWNIKPDDTALVRVNARQLKEEKIYQGAKEYNYDAFSRGMNFRDRLHEPSRLLEWSAFVPQMSAGDFQKFLQDMKTVSRTMNFELGQPKIITLSRPFGADYMNALENRMKETQGKLGMAFIVLPNNKVELYSILKQKLTKDWAVPSQCCLPKNLTKGLSVATKIAVQVSCKIGGVPWIIRNPFTKDHVCVIGFDVYHSGSIGGTSYGAIVATTNKEFSKTCSFVTAHRHREEVSSTMGTQIINCLKEYQKVNNGVLPSKIFFYRDGVGDGQVDIVYDVELESANDAIKKFYNEKKAEELPKLTYVIVSKRINTRFMVDKGNNEFDNPPPGTIVDDVVTLHYRYDFFLVSQKSKQGTVSPTSYNIIYDDNQLPPLRLQTFTFKLCHNYYNWNGTLSVPSVCQNAHKLAYITGEAIKGGCKNELRHLPFYL